MLLLLLVFLVLLPLCLILLLFRRLIRSSSSSVDGSVGCGVCVKGMSHCYSCCCCWLIHCTYWRTTTLVGTSPVPSTHQWEFLNMRTCDVGRCRGSFVGRTDMRLLFIAVRHYFTHKWRVVRRLRRDREMRKCCKNWWLRMMRFWRLFLAFNFRGEVFWGEEYGKLRVGFDFMFLLSENDQLESIRLENGGKIIWGNVLRLLLGIISVMGKWKTKKRWWLGSIATFVGPWKFRLPTPELCGFNYSVGAELGF